VWAASIAPKRPQASVRISLRLPRDVYDDVDSYAGQIGSDRTYVIVELLRRGLSAERMRSHPRAAGRSR
jgi:metal-responsive CopG/Arc/MetJ family transcriptional regulator